MEWLYKALEQYTYITVRSILFKFIALLAMFAFVREQSDYAECFLGDIIEIGNHYLGFVLPTLTKDGYSDELLADLLDSGVFGKSTKEHEAAGSLTRSSINNNAPRRFQRLMAIINTAFPKKQWMLKVLSF